MLKFQNKGHTIAGYPCVTLETQDEKVLAGSRGELWEYTPGTYRVLIAFLAGYEKIISIESKDLKKWILRLKVPRDPQEQAFWANNPNERFNPFLSAFYNKPCLL